MPRADSKPATPWSLLIDGTSLFFGQRTVSPDKTLNYPELNQILKAHVQSPLAPKPAIFFTAADESNEKQMKFHQLISDLGWFVRAVPPHEALVANPLLGDQSTRLIRFDAMLSYCLGRLAGQPEVKHVVLITDSWPLSGPVRDCMMRGTPVTVVYFGSLIDTRWHRTFRDAEAKGQALRFLDLDMVAPRLFDRTRPGRKRDDDILLDLP